ncbi:CRISPR-associated helicase Cas3' [Mycetocola tolaasinivorans]|uniref:CRISPR-associated helicase Cas3 n=1 Tax=Mycetocola tolaasinivorans TaxID=76635 RepID=A0A3L7A4T0_9MICO|nr:CRISPR-associated helicase Cas3' [Mycetocola tolaasinivorans]RLP74948.1 CRISPR-associated helicase Cas3' [Mycetocola tolaasinivorans]
MQSMRQGLSEAACSVWAKSAGSIENRAEVDRWLPLVQHLEDSAGIAALLWEHWVPRSVQNQIAAVWGGDLDVAGTVYAFLAGVHDGGKCAPSFSVMVPVLADAMTAVGLHVNPAIARDPDRSLARHELAGLIALRGWLVDTAEFSARSASSLASVVGAHHGRAPSALRLEWLEGRPDLLGDGPWDLVRRELIEYMFVRTGMAGVADRLRESEIPQVALVNLSALVIMADWIASNEAYFPLYPVGTSPVEDSASRVAAAWAALDFPSRWELNPDDDSASMSFADRFGLPAGALPNAVQAAALNLASEVSGPSMMIIEAAMGLGKTEAALGAAEALARRTGAGGIFVGLPTQATTDGMFPRVLAWADSLDQRSSVYLAHGKAALNPVFERMLDEARYAGIGADGADENRGGEDLVAHAWLSDRRRGPLASLVVGTIDQALFGALRSRHLMLRHLAFAGKVVILDEVHSADDFMAPYLDRMLHWMGAHGASVILLSATLPEARRVAMAQAYSSGRKVAQGLRSGRAARGIDRFAELRGDIGYPAITVVSDAGDPRAVSPSPGDGARRTEVHLEHIADDDAALIETLRAALAEGGCAGVIHNTVGRVQHTAGVLRKAFPDTPVIIAHSRYLAADRIARDSLLLDLFGHPRRATARPARAILVASQVAEQSLDIDLDILISDLAPVDLLFQRVGRLHRHQRGVGQDDRPAPLRVPRLLITGVDWETEPPTPSKTYTSIYAPYLLLRTLLELRGRNSLTVPDDVAPLVQGVYGEQGDVPAEWSEALAVSLGALNADRDDRARRAEAFLLAEARPSGLLGWASDGIGTLREEISGRAGVRDGEETFEVLVLWTDPDGALTVPPWLSALPQPIPLNAVPNRALVRLIRGTALRLPAQLCRPHQIDGHIQELEACYPVPQWHASYDLRHELVLVFDHQGCARLGEYALTYDHINGLEVTDVRTGNSHRRTEL